MKQKNYFLLLFALLFPFGLWAQNESSNANKEAEELFENTFPLGISLGIQTMSYSKSGNSGPFNHDLDPMWMPEFGFKYNLLQKNRFNFSVGLHVRYVRHKDFIYSYSHETDVYNISKDSQDDINYLIPLTAEYIFHTSGSTSFAAHIGYELEYDRNAHAWPYDKTVEDPNSDGKVRLYGDPFNKEFSHGLNLGFGVYQKLGSRLMKFELNYHLHFSQLMENRIIATDLPNQPDVNRSINWNGNNIAAKVTFYPFKRSKK